MASSSAPGSAVASGVSFLSAADAAALDADLMSDELGFSLEQLMELAGLSVASAISSEYPAASHGRVLTLAGPGNNGGDGLVAARHLWQMGYAPTICYPKPTKRRPFTGLVAQCRALGLPFVAADDLTKGGRPLREDYDLVIDSLFGFSFKGAPRPPFDSLLALLAPKAHFSVSPPPVVSVDIPSGWSVDGGDESGNGLRPDMLVSLTAPKLCARGFHGRHHYLGGRFVPPAVAEKYALRLPDYPRGRPDQCVRIDSQ
jgi:hydroxyethylthiazole kinase-like uncharacterized protein yjeF